MSHTPAAVEVIAALCRVLPRFGPWYLFGAQAVIAFGVPRLSADVDVTLLLPENAKESFVAAMNGEGFDLRVRDPDFVSRTRVFPFIHLSTAMPVDIVLAASGLEDEFLRRARPVEIEGVSVPTIDCEDLIITKILAGRPKDLEDARNLWRIHGPKMNVSRIHEILRLLEEALAQSDLLPAFEKIQLQP